MNGHAQFNIQQHVIKLSATIMKKEKGREEEHAATCNCQRNLKRNEIQKCQRILR